jgi:very-short-patch-repair endonuclease
VIDMATVLSPDDTRDLVDQSLMSPHLTPEQLERAITPRRRGVTILREVLEDGEDLAAAKSKAEQALGRLLKRAGLPRPEVNALVAGREFDFVWRSQKLIVEYDTWKWHGSPGRFENDREKQSLAQDAGFRVERMTKRNLYREPDKLLVRLGRALPGL